MNINNLMVHFFAFDTLSTQSTMNYWYVLAQCREKQERRGQEERERREKREREEQEKREKKEKREAERKRKEEEKK